MPLSRRRRATELLGLDAATHLNRSWLYGVATLDDEEHGHGDRPAGAVPSSSSQAGPPRHANGANGAGHAPMAHIVASPHGLVGHATEPQQRVIQVALGSEHGVLLTDAAIVFSWGDNRYGQLGRVACQIEEDGRPFPVLGMLGEEVVQVAAGKHHCLALSASGRVWSWGRNKAGQLGCGDYKDRVAPEQVRHEADSEHPQGSQLGARKNERITGISAGGASSVACGFNSSIWQWGEITNTYIAQTAQPKRTNISDMSASKTEELFPNRPLCVFRRDSYRTRMRRTKTSLSETAKQVISANEDVDRLKEMVDQVRQLKDMIGERRSALKKMESEKKKNDKERAKKGSDEVDDMGDTIAVLEQEISAAENDIYLYKKNLESCDHQKAHHRDQLQQISEQAVELSEREDRISLELIDAKKGTAEWKDLDDKLQEVKEYIQANQNSRMNILDRRAQADKEKQRLSRALDERVRLKIQLTQRHSTVKELSEASIRARDTSDVLLKFLGEQFREFQARFENKGHESELVSVMQDFEADRKFLQGVEARIKTFVDVAQRQGSAGTADRVGQVKTLLQELLELRAFYNVVLANQWVTEDLDISCFFDKATQPPEPGSFGQGAQAALPWDSQPEDQGDGAGPLALLSGRS